MEPVQRLFDGVYLINGDVGGRPLSLPLLVGRQNAMLLDTGCAYHVPQIVLPALRSLGIGPERLRWVVNTHCDVDHQGGNHAIKAVAPHTLLCCGDADRPLIEDPAVIFALRYDAYREKHHHYYPENVRNAIFADLGQPQPVDLAFVGGERIRLEEDWELEILRLPGHSFGHLGVLDDRHHALYGGDAIHGGVYLNLAGQPALCPTYLHVQPYLATIRLIEHLNIDCYSGCHWPVKRGGEIRQFCAESRQFVETAERLVLEHLRNEPATLTALCQSLSPKLGTWPQSVAAELAYALSGHLTDLQQRGLIEQIPQTSPYRYRAT